VVRLNAASKLNFMRGDELESLQSKMARIVRMGLESPDLKVVYSAASMVPYLPDYEKEFYTKRVTEIVRKGLESESDEDKKVFARMLCYVDQSQETELFELAKQKLGNALVENTLYGKKDISPDSFSRQPLEKTDSETTLIGGELKDKSIIRKIRPENFLAWQRVYEDHKAWKLAGFDYVPIEPIQSFKLRKDNLIDVYSGILDLTLDNWMRISGKYIRELKQEMDKILEVLSTMKIDHGHPHENNFCLRFYRDENGNVDFNKKPRIYLIDFDQAISLPEES
jgi:hypothetical protein